MRLIFITSGLEPGRDGVGDHVRALANELILRGHGCKILALNDRLCSEIFETKTELRLPETLGWKEREKRAGDWIREFSPDWISLHFVCYGFDRRGVPLRWPERFKRLAGAAHCQLMLHELWVGAGPCAPFKQRIAGYIQRKVLLRMNSLLRPRLVHTSNAFYQRQLADAGIQAEILPMFGAIPVELPLSGEISKADIESNALVAIIFGSLHPEWPPEPLLSMLRQAAERMRKRLTLVSIGNIGPGAPLWEKLPGKYPDIHFLCLGQKPVDEIALWFKRANFGISTTPLEIIGKSSAVAAMLEHGLPVIANRIGENPAANVGAGGEQIIPISDHLVEQIVALPRYKNHSRLKSTANTLLSQMAASDTR